MTQRVFRNVGLVSILAAFAAIAQACHSDETGPCVNSSDCRLGAYCNGGVCTTVAAPDSGDDDVDTSGDASDDATPSDDGSSDSSDAEDDLGGDDADVIVPSDVAIADVPPVTGGDAGSCVRNVRDLTVGATATTVYGALSGCSAIPSSTCQSDTRGPEDVYRVHVDSATGVVLDTDGPATTLDTVLSVRTMPNALGSETACNDDHDALATSRVRTVLTPGDHYVIVDQFGDAASGGTYQLNAREFVVAANAECAGAVASATTVTGTISRGSGAPYACAPQFDGPQLYYTVAVPAGHCVAVTVTPHGSWTPIVRELDACSASYCHGAAVVAPGGGMAATMHAVTTACGSSSSPAGTVIVSVGATDEPTPGSTFDATFTVM